MTLSLRSFFIVCICSAFVFLADSAVAVEMIRYAGATTLQKDFMPDAAHRFGAAHNVKFQLDGGNSDAGIKAVGTDSIDLAGSGRFLTSKEKADGLVEHLLGWDPLVVVAHATNPIGNVSRANLQRMVSGAVRNWKELGGRDLPILQVAAPSGSGVHTAVRHLILDDEPISRRAIVSLVVADADRNVALLPAAFTVTSLSMVDVENVKVIKLDHFPPDRQTIAAGDYPLIKPLLLITKGKPKGSLALFISFAKSPEGQSLLAKKFIPLASP